MNKHVVPVAIASLLILGACGSSSDSVESNRSVESNGSVESSGSTSPAGNVATFGDSDGVCPNPTLTNDDGDEEALAAAVDCLLEEIEAKRAVIVDMNIPTTEGDPTFYRFDFDGDTVLIVEDNRLDEFGSGRVKAQRCQSLADTGSWLPSGQDCEPEDHDGFTDADQ